MKHFLLLLVLFFASTTDSLFAAEVPFIKEYTYQASEADSKITSRTNAITEVKRLLLEEIGIYLESQTEVKNFRITKDEIIMFTAGILTLKIIEEKWNGSEYYLKAKITVDPEYVEKSIDNLRKDRQKAKELEDAKKREEELQKETNRLKKELETARNSNRFVKQKEYKDAMEKLAAFNPPDSRSWAVSVGMYTNGTQNAEAIGFEIFFDRKQSLVFRILQLDYDYTVEAYNDKNGTYSEKGSGKGGGVTYRNYFSNEDEPNGPYGGVGLNFYFVNYSSVDKSYYYPKIVNNASATVMDFNIEVGYKLIIFNHIDIEPALLFGAYKSSSGGENYYIIPGLSIGIGF